MSSFLCLRDHLERFDEEEVVVVLFLEDLEEELLKG